MERDISRADVKKCVLEGEIIEDYPDDFPHPSCLIFGYTINDKIIYVVAGSDGKYIILLQHTFQIQYKFEKDLKDKEEIDMCMFCKCDTVKQSTTTHVVNYKNSIIVIKKCSL